jgi:hypothetical protein
MGGFIVLDPLMAKVEQNVPVPLSLNGPPPELELLPPLSDFLLDALLCGEGGVWSAVATDGSNEGH